MSEQEWGKGAIFEPGIVRRVVEESVQVERPIEIETALQISPPVPDPNHVEPRPVLDNPQLVELWRLDRQEAELVDRERLDPIVFPVVGVPAQRRLGQ